MPVSLTCRTVPAFPVRQAGRLPHHNVSRPAQRSLALRPAWLLSRPWRPVPSECFNRGRYLPQPLRLLPAGATVAGRDSHPLGKGAFHGALSQSVFKHWPEIFNHDATLTSAVLDRLLHHAETVTVEGNSFRMKDVIDK